VPSNSARLKSRNFPGPSLHLQYSYLPCKDRHKHVPDLDVYTTCELRGAVIAHDSLQLQLLHHAKGQSHPNAEARRHDAMG
jgi:hypothetical protein